MSTTLPHGIIQINEGNIAWYGDITANWQLIDSKIGEYDAAVASIPAPANNGTLTINYGGTTLAMFGADDAGNVTADIPAPGDGTLTVTQGGSTLGSFSANQATPETIDIPAPGDGTLTIKVNGATAGTFTANQSTAATANITVPTAVSELTNDSGYLTSSSNLDASKLTSGTVDIARLPQGALERLIKVANETARYALTTADVQLGDTVQQLDTGIMYAVTDTDHLDSAAGYTEYTAGTAASVPWSGVTGKPTFAAVATSGAYSDLTGTPTIPTVNDATLTIQQNGTTLGTFTANASVDKAINITTTDDTKIPLAGSNQISGDLIPSTNNTIDIGSSSKKIKSVFSNYLNDINLSTLFDISNVGYTTDLNNETLRVRGKIIVCSYGKNTLNIPTPGASGLCFTIANQDSSDFGVQVALSNAGIYARFINNAQYGAWQVIPGRTYNVYDKTLTIQKNGTNVATFTSNSNTDVTANITVPTKVSELTNDSGFLTSADRLPVGSYIQFAGRQAPAGFLVCNGGAISRTTYSALFAVIGTTYGSGDGSTTFNLPNLTDRFLQGSTTSGTVKDAGLPNITGGSSGYVLNGGGGHFASGVFADNKFIYSVPGYPASPNWNITAGGGESYRDLNFDASFSNSIYGNSNTVQPPALTCLICIKY